MKIFRWWGLGVFAILGGATALFFLLFFDTVARWSLEKALSASLETVVDIDSVSSDLARLTFTVTGIAVADRAKPTHNALELGKVAFGVEPAPLFLKKLHITSMEVAGVAFDTQRAAPASIPVASATTAATPPKPPSPPATASPKAAAEDGGLTGLTDSLPDPKTLLEKEPLATKEAADKAGKRFEEINRKWRDRYTTQRNADKLTVLEKEYRALLKEAKAIRNTADLKSVQQKGKKLAADLDAQKKQWRTFQQEFQADRKEARTLLRHLQSLPDEDYRRLKAKYSLDEQGAFNLAGMLLNDKIQSYLQSTLNYYRLAAPYISRYREMQKEGESSTAERAEGRWVSYREFHPRPDLLIDRIRLEATLEKTRIEGLATGITDNQAITQKPMAAVITLANPPSYQAMELQWIGDRRSGVTDYFTLQVSDMKPGPLRSGRFSATDNRADFQMKATLAAYEKLDGEGLLRVVQSRLFLENPKGELEKIVAGTLSGIDRFDVTLKIRGVLLSPDITITSDLDKKLSRRFSAELKKKREAYEKALQKAVNDRTKKELAKLGASEKEMDAVATLLNGEAAARDAFRNEIAKRFSSETLKKELEARAKKEANEKLKGFLKGL